MKKKDREISFLALFDNLPLCHFKNTIISFKDTNFWPKICLILYLFYFQCFRIGIFFQGVSNFFFFKNLMFLRSSGQTPFTISDAGTGEGRLFPSIRHPQCLSHWKKNILQVLRKKNTLLYEANFST